MEEPDAYVEEWKDDPWYPAIAEAHDLLKAFIPGYTPVQIKSKFGGLRFYFTIDAKAIDPHDPKRELYRKLANAIVWKAEADCSEIDRRTKRASELATTDEEE
ncbi:MAG TPA: hypothetical protein VGK43_00415 [Solirubrobacterales bacterium]